MIPKEANNTTAGGAPIPHSGQSGRGVQLGTVVRFALKGPQPGWGVLRLVNGMGGHINPFFNLLYPHWPFFVCVFSPNDSLFIIHNKFLTASYQMTPIMTTFHQTFIFFLNLCQSNDTLYDTKWHPLLIFSQNDPPFYWQHFIKFFVNYASKFAFCL